MAETLAVDGTELTTNAALTVRVAGGLYTGSGRRGRNIVVPGRHGELRIPHKPHTAGRVKLEIDVVGVDPVTGLVPGGSSTASEFRARVDELLRLFSPETFTLDHGVDGVVRRCVGELDLEPVVIDPIPAVQDYGQATFEIRVPGAFWTDTGTTTSGPHALATGATVALTEFVGASAPMDELTLTFGPQSNPSLAQPLTGFFVAYDAVIAAGQELTVDTATWALGTGAGTAWTPDVTKLRFGPTSRFFALTPPPDGTVPVVELTHTGGGTGTVTITGRRKYRTA